MCVCVFVFQGEPVDYVDAMCVNMQQYLPQHYITGDQLLTEYKPKVQTT